MIKRIEVPTITRDGGAGEAEITISTAAVDRVGDRVIPEGAQLDGYRRNPVVLWGHDARALPIATTTDITVEPGVGLRARFRWLQGDEFAGRVRNAWEQGLVRSASIGFLPLASTPNRSGGEDFLRWDLMEWSLVSVPANPDAVRQLKAMGLGINTVLRAVREALAELAAPSPRRQVPEAVGPAATRLVNVGGRLVRTRSLSLAWPVKGAR